MCCILIPLALSWQIKLLLVVAIVSTATYAVCGYGLLLFPWSVVALTVNVKNELQIMRRDGVQLPDLSVCADSVVTPYLTVVHVYAKNAPLWRRIFARHLIILPDAVDTESYRQLRVWLRWGYEHHHDQVNLTRHF